MGDMFWMPGAVIPFEPCCPLWQEAATIRWVVHANGRGGSPSWDLEVGAMHGSHRVLVSSSTGEAYPTVQDQRLRAAQLLVSLPSMLARPRPDRMQILESARDRGSWADASFKVDRDSSVGQSMTLASGEWCLNVETATGSIQVAGHGVPAAQIAVQAVTHWGAYGIDLSTAQSSDAVRMASSTAMRAWEAAGTGDLHLINAWPATGADERLYREETNHGKDDRS